MIGYTSSIAFIWQLRLLSTVGMALEFKYVVETHSKSKLTLYKQLLQFSYFNLTVIKSSCT